MPTYTAQCTNCASTLDYLRPMERRHETPPCKRCGGSMVLTIRTAPKGFVRNRWQPFRSTVDGSIIRNGRELQEHNKRNNVVSMAEGHSTEQLLRMKGEPPPREKVKHGEVAEAIQMVKNGYKPQIGADI